MLRNGDGDRKRHKNRHRNHAAVALQSGQGEQSRPQVKHHQIDVLVQLRGVHGGNLAMRDRNMFRKVRLQNGNPIHHGAGDDAVGAQFNQHETAPRKAPAAKESAARQRLAASNVAAAAAAAANVTKTRPARRAALPKAASL
jgi:hypothetical protein